MGFYFIFKGYEILTHGTPWMNDDGSTLNKCIASVLEDRKEVDGCDTI